MNSTTAHGQRLQPLIVGFPVLLLLCFFAGCPVLAADLHVTSIQITNNNVCITWDAPGGSNYVLQSATSLIAPDGRCQAYLPYGQEGVLVQGINVEAATGLIARRLAPERYPEIIG